MTQIYKRQSGTGPTPPDVPTSFVTQDGTGVPAANILLVNGLDSNESNDNGIITKGGTPATGNSNEIDVVITNRVRGSATTADATPTAISTFSLGTTPGVYNLDIQIAGFDVTDTAGCGYFISGSVRTTGAAASLVGTPDKIVNEEAGVTTACDANLVIAGNNAIIQVTGIAAKTINWKSLGQYIFVS